MDELTLHVEFIEIIFFIQVDLFHEESSFLGIPERD